MRTVVFLLRIDSVNGKPEGEYYPAVKGVISCNLWSSPKLVDQRVIIATGEKAIKKVFDDNPDYHITRAADCEPEEE